MIDKKEQKKMDFRVTVFVIVCLMLNYFGKGLALKLHLPLWLDSIGTVFATFVLGPACGALVGLSVNVIYAMEEPDLLFYLISSIAISMVVGWGTRRNMFDNLFRTSTVATVLTLVATITSTPINCLVNDGYIGNLWGDGIYEMLREWEVNWVLASVIAQIMLEFVDKLFTVLILYLAIAGRRKKVEKSGLKEDANWFSAGSKKIISSLLAFVLLLHVFALPCSTVCAAESTTEAAEEDYNSYIQTIYSNNNGLLSGEANDIVATNDGILWIATYAGLYRYNGTNFTYMNQYESVRNANDLYMDVEGRLWIGTNDNGLSIWINGDIANVLDETDGLPSNSVRTIVQQSNGNYFIGTTDALAVVSLSGGIRLVQTIPEIMYARSLAADDNNHIVAVNSEGNLYLLDGTDLVYQESASKAEKYFTCCVFDQNGTLYVGTENGSVHRYVVMKDKLVYEGKMDFNGFSVINSLNVNDKGELFVCADNGVACVRSNKTSYISLGSFNSSIERMTVDYQGNLWFTSSRLGIVKLCKTAFSELYQTYGIPETVVNTITRWKGDLYCGTDTGLDIIRESTGKVVHNELSRYLQDTRVRSVMVDSQNNLWICTYGKGVICVDINNNRTVYDEGNQIDGSRFRHALELSDGTIAVSNDKGVVWIKDGKVTGTVGVDQGLTNSVVLCLLEGKDGILYAGTDGGGICMIQDGQVIKTIRRENGLSSNVILRMTKNKENDGIFITTSNGLCYINELGETLSLSNFPYSNNYDVYETEDGRLLIPSSAGIYILDKDNLLSQEECKYDLLNYMSGLRGTLTANAWNYVENDEDFYFANGSGVTKLDLDNYKDSAKSFRMVLQSVNIDGKSFWIDRNEELFIPRDAVTVELNPEIINYSSNDPYVRYTMQGVNDGSQTVRQSELSSITYTNLKAGNYTFILSILDEDGRVIEEQTYSFVKEKKIYDNLWFKICFFVELILIIAWISWFITRTTVGRTLEIQRQEIELTKKQIAMGNETILAIAKTVDAKDENTSQHSIRVSEYSVLIARKLGYNEEDIENLRKAALLHDIGKIGIPDSVLNKPGRLTDEEYALMKSHVIRGGEILKDFTIIPNVQVGAMYHHERYDGKGYMFGLKGEEIPEWARIIGIADAFDAMTANRVYRKQLDFDYVLEEVRKGRGTQFDPRMADILLQLVEDGEIDVGSLYAEKKDIRKQL